MGHIFTCEKGITYDDAPKSRSFAGMPVKKKDGYCSVRVDKTFTVVGDFCGAGPTKGLSRILCKLHSAVQNRAKIIIRGGGAATTPLFCYTQKNECLSRGEKTDLDWLTFRSCRLKPSIVFVGWMIRRCFSVRGNTASIRECPQIGQRTCNQWFRFVTLYCPSTFHTD